MTSRHDTSSVDPRLIRIQAQRDQCWASLRKWKQELETMAAGGQIDERLAQKLAHMVLADMSCGDRLVTSIEPLPGPENDGGARQTRSSNPAPAAHPMRIFYLGVAITTIAIILVQWLVQWLV